MTSLVVVQHGDKQRSPGDPGLTALGRAQAQATAAWLAAGPGATALYSSPMRRARETAEPIAAALGLAVTVDSRLRERMNWDASGGRPLEAFLAEWARTNVDRSFVPTAGDSSDQAGGRFLAAIDELATRHPHGTVVAVAHGGVTVDLLRTVLGDAALAAIAPRLIEDGVPCCALTRLVHAGDGWQVTAVASTAHLPADGVTAHQA